ncbi:MAG TPA: helix-turn-helix transcriptional regulator [Polyangiales bacterium]|nr:helix-turn-helix transcriptional regulator [Polyangiales bacterium]
MGLRERQHLRRLALSVRSARKAANLSQVELAKKLGTTQAGVARLESGRARPNVATLLRIAAETGHLLKMQLHRPASPSADR